MMMASVGYVKRRPRLTISNCALTDRQRKVQGSCVPKYYSRSIPPSVVSLRPSCRWPYSVVPLRLFNLTRVRSQDESKFNVAR
jgi:hypothetical protein